ncbi:MAG: HD domain-containing protein [Acidimicrobiales bacterium]|nr:HD domain-containing protein [Acidimicrobiales bacterium]
MSEHPLVLAAAMAALVTGVAVTMIAGIPGSEPTGGGASLAVRGVLVTGLAGACLVASAIVLAIAARRRLAELALLGGGLTMLSGLSVVHGLTAGTGSIDSSWVAMALAFPAMAVVALPLLLGAGTTRARLARVWIPWISAWLVVLLLVGTAMLVVPLQLPPELSGVRFVGAAGLVVVVTARLAARQVELHRIGRQRVSAVAAGAVIGLAGATIAGLSAEPASARWWAAHVVNGAFVLLTVGAAAVLVQRNRTLTAVLAPVLADDPVAALELGLAPEVHAFIAALDRKDAITRDHTIRVGHLAVRAARRAGMRGARLRAVGLGAIMHDIGKLVVPSDVLVKPGALTGAEYAVIKTHAARGAALLAPSPDLAPVAPLVRWHHERHDGGGYPDGLAGDQIPFEVALISVCDAWDALTNDRHYRAGRSAIDAEAVLRGGAGSQWHPRAVDVVLAAVGEEHGVEHFAGVGKLVPTPGPVVPGIDDIDCADLLMAEPEQSTRYRAPFDDAPFAYFTVAPSGIITGANHKTATLLGRAPNDLVGTLVLDLYSDGPCGRSRAEQLLERFRQGEPIEDEELVMRRADGGIVRVRLSVIAATDEAGRIVESRSIVVGITGRSGSAECCGGRDGLSPRRDLAVGRAGASAGR